MQTLPTVIFVKLKILDPDVATEVMKPFTGEKAFASNSTLIGKLPYSKIDDILSIIYLMVFLIRGYNLPWPTSDNFVNRLADTSVIL